MASNNIELKNLQKKIQDSCHRLCPNSRQAIIDSIKKVHRISKHITDMSDTNSISLKTTSIQSETSLASHLIQEGINYFQ